MDIDNVQPDPNIVEPEPQTAVTPTAVTPVVSVPVTPVEPAEEGPYQKTSDGWKVTIDLGEGSGKQVFKGRTKSDVTKQLVEAQINATKKIRQQEKRIKLGVGLAEPKKAEPLPEFNPRQLTPEEKWQISQDLTDPVKAFDAHKRLNEASFGVSEDTIRGALRKMYEAESISKAQAIAANWVSKHPEFYNTVKNRETMRAYFEKHGFEISEESFNYAFIDLSDSGLLEEKPEEVQPEPEPEPAAPVAPVTPVTVQPPAAPAPELETVVPRPAPASQTGLSSRNSSVADVKAGRKPGLTVEEYRKMPASEVKRRINSGDSWFIAEVERLAAEGKI